MTRRRAFMSGGISRTSSLAPVEEHALASMERERPRVCFLLSASSNEARELDRHYDAYSGLAPRHISLFNRRRNDVLALQDADLLVVGGGNTANLLALIGLHELREPLIEAHQRGTALLGVSAGASVLFDACLTDSFGPPLRPIQGLGIVPGSVCAHGKRTQRRARFIQCIGQKTLPAGWAVGDASYICFDDGEPKEYVGHVERVEIIDGRTQATQVGS